MGGYLAYPEYKESGVEWLGEIPIHWKVKRLKNIASCNDEALNEDTDPDYEIEYVDISSVNLIEGITHTEIMPFEKAPSRARRKVRDGDTIVSTVRTYLKSITAIREPSDNTIVSTGFAVIRPRKSLEPDYVGYLLQTEGFVGNVVANSVGVSYPAINSSDLTRLPVVEPPPEEQRQIAAFLDYKTGQIDALITKKEALLEKLAEKRTALISQAVTKGLDPTVPMQDSGIPWLGDIPNHWRPIKLRFLLSRGFTNGLFKKKDQWGTGYRIVNVFDVYEKGDIIKEEKLDRVECSSEEADQYSAEHGDFFFVRSSLKLEGIGKSAIVFEPQEKLVFECHLVRGRPNLGLANSKFLNFYLNSIFARETLISIANQVTMATIDQSKFKNLVIALPSFKEQENIVSFLENSLEELDAVESKVESAISRLTEYRTALITNAVTGKIDVRDIKLPTPTPAEAA